MNYSIHGMYDPKGHKSLVLQYQKAVHHSLDVTLRGHRPLFEPMTGSLGTTPSIHHQLDSASDSSALACCTLASAPNPDYTRNSPPPLSHTRNSPPPLSHHMPWGTDTTLVQQCSVLQLAAADCKPPGGTTSPATLAQLSQTPTWRQPAPVAGPSNGCCQATSWVLNCPTVV
jgi:hypothetical protein